MEVNIKIYFKNGDKEYVKGVNYKTLKKNAIKKLSDGSYKMNNGDLIEIVSRVK